MTILSLSQEFTINQVGFTSKTDSFVNIQKRKELVQFRSASSSDNVNLAFVQSEDLNSSTNLSVADRSTSLVENRSLTELDDQILEAVAGFTIETDLFLLTDIFTVNLITQQPIPLFFQHNLSRTLAIGETYNDIKLVDQSFESVLSSSYVVDDTLGIVYSNLENTFDAVTGLSEISFVTYTVKKTNGVLERYTEILNNAPVFHLAEIEDIDLDTGTVLAGHKVYVIEKDVGTNFSVTLPIPTRYGLRRTSTSRVEILEPQPTDTNNPWFVRVRSGKFLSAGITGIKKYYIAEFGSQAFLPYFPFKQTDETSYRVSKRIIKTLKNKIAISDIEFLYPEVVVYDKNGAARFALTSNPTRVGQEALATGINFSNVLLGNSKVAGTGLNAVSDPISGSSIDSFAGFIVLPAGYEIAETDLVRSIYTYSESDYEFTLFDFNPLDSVDLAKQRIVLVLRPESLGSTLLQTLYYLVVNEDGLVIDSDIDFALTGLDNVPVEDLIASGQLWYDRNPALVTWADPNGKNFVDWCTVEGDNNQDDILILGDIYSRESISPSALILHDVRVRGGGVQKNKTQNSISLNSETEWFWDIGIWDGKPFPGAASVLVDIPIDILSTVAGMLTPVNVTEIVNRHIALGVYPVIHGYNNYQPTVTGLLYVEPGFYTLQWTAGPPDIVYDVYESIETQFFLLASGLTINEYTASGINQKVLLVTGRPEDSDTAYLGGSIFEIKSFVV